MMLRIAQSFKSMWEKHSVRINEYLHSLPKYVINALDSVGQIKGKVSEATKSMLVPENVKRFAC